MSDDARTSKVERVIDEYSLEGLDAVLVDRWTSEGEERSSLRQLAEHFNQRVLHSAMEEAGLNPLEGEVENIYELLTGEDVSGGMRTQALKRLEQGGVDVDRLQEDFVTHQTIHNYLTKYQGVDLPEVEETGIENDVQTIRRLQNRLRAVTESTLDRLQNTDRLSLGSGNVIVEVRVICERCGARYDPGNLLETGACDCPVPSPRG